MGFETPLALLALVAAGLPILAHLLRRQDLPTHPLPTIVLLQRAEAQNKKRVRLVDLLLLLLRVLLIAAAALAIAGPFLRVTLSYGDGSVASVAIVIDDSMSADARGLGPTMRERALDVLDSLPAGSEVTVVLGGQPARLIAPRTDDLAAAERAIATAERGRSHGTDLASAIQTAEQELSGARHSERRILVLTDGAAHAGMNDLTARSGIGLEIEVVETSEEIRNAAVVETRATPDPTGEGMTSVAAVVRASAGLEGESLEVVLRDADERVLAREAVEIQNGGAQVTLRAVVGDDDPRGSVSIELDDTIEADNRRGVLLRRRTAARVLVVDGDPHPVRGTDEARFVARAIDLAPNAEGLGSALSRRTVDTDTFDTLDLSDVDVVVLANVAAPSAPVIERLRSFVTRGGGLWIAPGDHFDARVSAARFGDLLPGRPQLAAQADVQGPNGDPEAGWFERPDGLEQTTTRRRLTFDERPVDAVVPLRFSDGSPAMLVVRYGAGKVAVLATTLDDDWTDLPFQPGYLPLVVSTVRRLAPAASMPDRAFAPGEPVTLIAPAGASRLTISTPDRRVLEFEGDELSSPIVVARTDAAGVYQVEVATEERALHVAPPLAFLVAPPPEESDLSPGSAPAPTEVGASGSSSRVTVNRPIAKWLFLLVGLLALSEAAVRLRMNRRRRLA